MVLKRLQYNDTSLLIFAELRTSFVDFVGVSERLTSSLTFIITVIINMKISKRNDLNRSTSKSRMSGRRR